MGRSSRQKINMETAVLNDTSGQMDLIDFFNIPHFVYPFINGHLSYFYLLDIVNDGIQNRSPQDVPIFV